MKLKIGLIVVIVAGFMASYAVAASPNKGGNGKAQSTSSSTTKKAKKVRTTCRLNGSLILKGKLLEVTNSAAKIAVKQTNKHARSFKGKDVTIQTNAKTKVLRLGERVALLDLVVGDSLNVQARTCKRGDLPAAPLATRIVAKPASS